MQGNVGAAEALRAEIDFRDRINKAIIEEDKLLQNQLNTLKNHRIVLAEVDKLERERARRLTNLDNKETSLLRDIETSLGRQGELTQKVLEIRKEKIAYYDEELRKLDEILSKEENISYELEERRRNLELDRQNEVARQLSSNPMTTGLTGSFGFIQDFKDRSRAADTFKSNKENILNANLAKATPGSEQHAKLLAEKLELDREYTYNSAQLYTGLFSNVFDLGADTFAGLTQAAIRMHGAQSKEARKAFAQEKAMRIASATMATAQAVINALATAPWPLSIALAALAGVMGALQIAQIASQPMPAAHGGLTNVPKEQTYLLDKGERVLSPNQNKDLTNFMKSAKDRKNTVDNKGGNTYNISVAVKTDKNDSPDEVGEKIALGMMRQIAKQEIQNAKRVGNSLNPINRV
jgi:hypothetical protein